MLREKKGNEYRYFIINKPVGVVCSRVDPMITNIVTSKGSLRCGERYGGKARQTVYDMMIENNFPTDVGLVGRLDTNTSGVMLLTDDCCLASSVRDPPKDYNSKNVYKCKEYELTTVGERLSPENITSTNFLQEISSPFQFQRANVTYYTNPAQVELIRHWRDPERSYGQSHLGWCVTLKIILYEGKHHQIRRMAKRSGVHVISLHRNKIAKILTADSLPIGGCRWLSSAEIDELYDGFEIRLKDKIPCNMMISL